MMRSEAADDRGEAEERNKRVSTLISTAAKGVSVLIWGVAMVIALREQREIDELKAMLRQLLEKQGTAVADPNPISLPAGR